MTIHVQTVTLTVFSNQPINPDVLADSIIDGMHKLGAVVDIEMGTQSSLTDANGQMELWNRGFDPNVLDDYDADDTSGYVANFQTFARHESSHAGY